MIYQQCIYWDLRRIVCFQRRYIFKNRLARFARTQSCIHFLQFPTRRHSIRPYIMNINEHIKWTNTRTYCTDKNMLYTYQLNNCTFSTQNTKISARSLAISYICFQVRIVKKTGGGSHTINYYGKSGDSRTPDPRQGLYTRNCNGRNYTSYHSWRPSWRPLFAENSRASGGSAPWAPGRGPTAGPWTPPRRALRAHTVRYAHGFFRPPLFLQILDPPLYTSPLARPSRLPPEASILGELGSSRPPPPNDFFFFVGGANISFCPPPPNNFVNLKNWYVMQE